MHESCVPYVLVGAATALHEAWRRALKLTQLGEVQVGFLASSPSKVSVAASKPPVISRSKRRTDIVARCIVRDTYSTTPLSRSIGLSKA